MPNSSVFSSPSYRAKLPKTTFPMTQEIDFSSTAGTLTPVYCDFLHPGEKVSGHAEMFTRTNELQTAAFAKIDEYIEYFFVPANKLNQVFGEWFFNIDDRPTTLRPSELPERANVLPNVTYTRLKSYMNSIKTENPGVNPVDPRYLTKSASLVRILQHYRYDVYHLFDEVGSATTISDSVWNIPLVPFQAYQAVYYDYYRDTLWENNDVEAYNTDDWLTSLTSANISDGRLTKIFKLHQRRQNSDYFTGCHPSPLQNATGMLNIDGVREAALLQLNNWLENSGISFSFGRNSDSPAGMNNNITLNQPVSGSASITGNGEQIGSLYSDALTDNGEFRLVQNSSGSDGVLDAEVEISGGTTVYPLGSSSQRLEYLGGLQLDDTEVDSISGPISGLSVVLNNLKTSISSTGIRTMFALEKLAKITGRAGKHYDDQVLAHYGVKVSPAYSNEVQMIGQQHSTIEIGEVVSPTTVPDGSVAGEIVGKGYGNMKSDDKVVDFTAPCHGYFMAIYSAVPRRVYTPVGNPREYSQMYRFDFMQPELMNLGQQPLFFTEFDLTSLHSYPVAGWNWRYMEEKCRVPMAIGALSRFSNSSQSLNGILSDWTIQYPVFNEQTSSLGYNDFKVMPSAFNSIMLMQWSNSTNWLGSSSDTEGASAHGSVARLFDRDPLFHRLVMKIYKSSYMSTFGEPSID